MTNPGDLPDLLAAASLLLTLISFLYGLLYSELVQAADITLAGRQPDDVGPDRTRIRSARLRAVFLAVLAAAMGAVFAPPTIHICSHFLGRLSKGVAAFDHYNALALTLVIVNLGFFVLAGHASWMTGKLTTALNGLSPGRGSGPIAPR
jgi:hypothetical protein